MIREYLHESLFLILLFHLGTVSSLVVKTTNAPLRTTSTVELKQSGSSSVLDPWRDYEELRNVELTEDNLVPFFQGRPQLVASRLFQIFQTLYGARKEWEQASKDISDGVGVEDNHGSNDGDVASIMDEVKEEEMERNSKLCQAVSSLGPVAVKIGQTLSQRPDLVGVEAAIALKTLQTKNVPYDNQLAYGVIHESFDHWSGPIAPGIHFKNSNIDPDGPTLFANMTQDPVACASLGQVYKATMHDGSEVAVKVQRPDALSLLAKDVQCFRFVCGIRAILGKIKTRLRMKSDAPGYTEEEIRQIGGANDMSVGSVINRVACDIKKELDYTIEAKNSIKFKESLSFLGFVTTPDVIKATDRVLLTEWIPGRHLENLSEREGLAMTRMAVEACTASLVLTGFVHADPHEGNLMLHDNGQVVFLDFGLMSDVDTVIMEGFARGIQALLSQNWLALTEAMVDVGFVTTPIMHRANENDNWVNDPEKYGIFKLAEELEVAMKTTEGGVSQFGALATVLNKKISPTWLVFTPPYVLLLIRTFLTLEGISASIDPNFNIYKMAMPWAMRRSLSPSTKKGIEVFRSTLLTEENKIQWKRFVELTSTLDEKDVGHNQNQKQSINNNEVMKDTVASLLGSSEGKALRRALKDLDSIDLIEKISSRDSRHLLRLVVSKYINYLSANKLQQQNKEKENSVKEEKNESVENYRPVSEESIQLKVRQSRRKKWVIRFLILGHVKKCMLRLRGLKAMLRLALVGTKVFFSAFMTSKSRINTMNGIAS